jgi:hypothetical protein
VPVYYGYNAILGAQSTVNGAPVNYAFGPTTGGTWTWSGDQTWFHVRENNGATVYNGDPTNEQVSPNEQIGQPGEQLAWVNGAYRQTIWDYTFTISSGTTTYRVAVIDIDFNNDDDLDDANEDGYFLVFPDGVPPAGASFTVGSITDNGAYVAHSTLGTNVVCFVAGTMIATERGEMPVERLRAGDLVLTRDRGLQPLRWTGSRRVVARGTLAPVVFRCGAIGNRRRLAVSPQHRMLVGDWRAELLFGETSVLVRAKDLVDDDRVVRVEGGFVDYHHILFDRHEIVYAEGVPSESFQPGAQALGALERECRDELLALFPNLGRTSGAPVAAARRSLKRHEAACLRAA